MILSRNYGSTLYYSCTVMHEYVFLHRQDGDECFSDPLNKVIGRLCAGNDRRGNKCSFTINGIIRRRCCRNSYCGMVYFKPFENEGLDICFYWRILLLFGYI